MKQGVCSWIFLVAVMLSPGTHAQTSVYHPLPDSNAVWQVEYGGYQCSCCASYHYAFDGDTVIGSIAYHKIHVAGVAFFENTITGFCTSNISGTINHIPIGNIFKVLPARA